MIGTRSIEIDFDVHKFIETNRNSFDETPNHVLKRVLKIQSKKNNEFAVPSTLKKAWSSKGVSLPHGTQLKMEYGGSQYTGSIENGEWLVEGEKYNSPSAAAIGVARTRQGKKTSLNGWLYWNVQFPNSDRWQPLASIKN